MPFVIIDNVVTEVAELPVVKVVTAVEEETEDPMHIDVKDLTFGYVGREVNYFSIVLLLLNQE